MEHGLKNNDLVNKVIKQLTADKKKSITAICLIVVMAFMWIKMLAGKKPNAAKAEISQTKTVEDQPDTELKMSFIELPNIKGRNDVLARDFFRFSEKDLSASNEIRVVSEQNGKREEVVRRVTERLRLEAIGFGQKPQAFINDKLLSIGDKLFIKDGANKYECEIVEIKENNVLIRYGKSLITLKLSLEP